MRNIYSNFTKLFLVVFLATISLGAFAQDGTDDAKSKKSSKSSFNKYWYIGANVGASFFHGDIAEYKMAPDFSHFEVGFGGILGWQFSPVFGVRGQLMYANLSGEATSTTWKDKNYYDKRFEGNTIDYSLQLTIEIDDIFKRDDARKYGVYAFMGVGNFQYRTEMYDATTGKLLNSRGHGSDQGGGDAKGIDDRDLVGSIPVGLGFKYAVTEKLDINLESSLRFGDTDGMDGIESGAKAIKEDFYSFTSLGITYNFGRELGGSIKSMQRDFENVELKAEPNVLEAKGDEVEVTVNGVFPEKYFSKRAVVLMVPMLISGTDTTKLDPIQFRGENVQGAGQPIAYKTGGTFSKSMTIPYDPKMNNSELHLVPYAFLAPKDEAVGELTLEDIQKYEHLILGDRKVADGIIYTCKNIMNDQDAIILPHGYEKETILSKSADVYFPVNRYNLNWRFGLNKSDAAKAALEEMTDFIKLGYTIKDIELNGWASPEGEETFNENLSENRGKSTQKYLTRKLKGLARGKDATVGYESVDELTINIKGNGPDWNGFMNNVKSSNVKDKNIILNVVNFSDPLKREEEIRNMILVYPELEDEILPPLRRAIITVNAYEPKKTEEEIAMLSTTDPSKLNLKELLFAATLTDDNATKMSIYEAAIKEEPNCWTAYNNAGFVALAMGDKEKAHEYFEKANTIAPDKPAVINNLGVIYAMNGNYEKAEEYFDKASKLGASNAYNRGTLQIRHGKYAEALKLMGDKKCNYNVALAQLLKGDDANAKEVIECAETNCGTLYLKAIIGARTGDTAYMYENLTEAIKLKPEFKEKAKNDREFIEYFDDPDFINVVK
jgi:tetratricopeptide (TPR) repeat protein